MAQIVCPWVSAKDRARLEAIVADRNRAQKHVARARIILGSADRLNVAEVARRAGVGRPAVWRWQQRFAEAGVEGLLRDATRKPGKAPLGEQAVRRVVTLTCAEPRAPLEHAWTDGAGRFLRDYVAESQDAATATEQAFATAFSGAEDSLVGFIATGKLQFGDLADSVLADLARMTVRQTLTAPLAGALQGALGGGDLFGLFHQGGIAGERPPAMRHVDPGIFDHAPRYHGGGFAGSGLLPDEVPIVARRGELVVPPERVVREEKTAREQRPITVVVNVTAADASSFRASQGQIAADMARAIDRASRHR